MTTSRTVLDRNVVEWHDEEFDSGYALHRRVQHLWRLHDNNFAAPWRRGQAVLEATPLQPPSWKPNARKEFLRSIGHADKQMRQRIMDALKSICLDPVSPLGNTKSPMQGNLLGLWRYRIGDFRIIYRPDAEKRRVELLAFSSRQDAYNDVDA